MAVKIISAGPFDGARAMKPTLKHRPAIWECMLGTVYASNGVTVRYFDYDWAGAREFAGVNAEGADARVARSQHSVSIGGHPGPRRGQRALYVRSKA